MIRRRALLLGGVTALGIAAAPLDPGSAAPDLSRGVAIVHWFRFPARWGSAAVAAYVPDAALAALRQARFTAVRIPIQPELLGSAFLAADIASAVRRVQAAGLTALLTLYPVQLQAERSADQAKIQLAWDAIARALSGAPLTGALAIEPLNEPVFPPDGSAWPAFRAELAATIRTHLPKVTLVQAGALFDGVDGMGKTPPAAGPGIVAGFHFYEPSEVTALAAYNPAVDHAALAQLPFPVLSSGPCVPPGLDAQTLPTATFYCSLGWDAARIGARFDQVRAAVPGLPVVLGEFGATNRLPAATRLAWIVAARTAAEARGFGWCLWALDDSMGFAVVPGAALDAGLLEALGLEPLNNMAARRLR